MLKKANRVERGEKSSRLISKRWFFEFKYSSGLQVFIFIFIFIQYIVSHIMTVTVRQIHWHYLQYRVLCFLFLLRGGMFRW